MNQTQADAPFAAPAPGADGLHARMAALRAQGADRLDPARLLALEALLRRLPAQPDAVQAVLQQRALAALADCEQRCLQRTNAALAPRAPAALRPQPLAALNAHIGAARAAQADVSAGCEAPPADALRSAWRFREALDRGRTLDQLRQALARKPANPGPLNSHALVLQALDRVGELSPDYLRRFVSQMETLLWLDAAVAKPAREAAKPVKAAKAVEAVKPARRARGKKPR
jgi:hypothetical protein